MLGMVEIFLAWLPPQSQRLLKPPGRRCPAHTLRLLSGKPICMRSHLPAVHLSDVLVTQKIWDQRVTATVTLAVDQDFSDKKLAKM